MGRGAGDLFHTIARAGQKRAFLRGRGEITSVFAAPHILTLKWSACGRERDTEIERERERQRERKGENEAWRQRERVRRVIY